MATAATLPTNPATLQGLQMLLGLAQLKSLAPPSIWADPHAAAEAFLLAAQDVYAAATQLQMLGQKDCRVYLKILLYTAEAHFARFATSPNPPDPSVLAGLVSQLQGLISDTGSLPAIAAGPVVLATLGSVYLSAPAGSYDPAVTSQATQLANLLLGTPTASLQAAGAYALSQLHPSPGG
jgi:hypothetical protein